MLAVIAATISALSAPATAAAPVPRAASGEPGMRLVGAFVPTVTNPAVSSPTFPYSQSIRLVAAWRQRLLYTVDNANPSMVSAYNLDTLQPVSKTGVFLSGSARAVLVDEKAGSLVLAVSGSSTGFDSGATQALEVVDVQSNRLVVRSTTNVAGQLGDPTQSAAGLTWLPDGLLGVLSADSTGSVPGTVRLTAVDLRRRLVLWSQPLTGCQTLARTGYAAAVGYDTASKSVYFGCSGLNTLGVYKPPLPIGVGRAVLRSTTGGVSFDRFELYPLFGDFTSGAPGEFDPGSGRLLLQSYNVTSGSTFNVFDGRDGVYVGGAGGAKNSSQSSGVDALHGRVYVQTANKTVGIIAVDVRQTPIGAGVNFPEFGGNPFQGGTKASVAQQAPLAVDPTTGRVFASYSQEPRIAVLQDTTPYYDPPPPPNVDLNTVDMAEKTGVTAAQYTAAAQGYGAIYRQVGGTRNVQFNVVPFDPDSLGSPVRGGTRELDTAYLSRLALDVGSAGAAAVSAERDGNTKADQSTVTAPWPYQPAACSDFGGQPKKTVTPGAQAECDVSKATVAASANGGGSTVTLPGGGAPVDIGVAASSVDASAQVDPVRGLVTTVTATARGISVLGGLLRIGQVAQTVQAWAHGRPGTAGSKVTRTLEDVTVAGQRLCGSTCDVTRVATTINGMANGQLRVDFPSPDAFLAKGSPGGYQAVVQRSLSQQTQEVVYNEQPADRQEVPAMVISVYEDNTTPARTIAYLAGASSEAYYGIYLLGAPAGSGTGGDVPGSGPRAAGTGGGTGQAGTDTDPGPDVSLPGTGTGLGGPTDSGPTVAPPTASSGSGGLLTTLGHGLQLAVNGLVRALRLLGVWATLLVPVYLSARRRLLLRRGALIGAAS